MCSPQGPTAQYYSDAIHMRAYLQTVHGWLILMTGTVKEVGCCRRQAASSVIHANNLMRRPVEALQQAGLFGSHLCLMRIWQASSVERCYTRTSIAANCHRRLIMCLLRPFWHKPLPASCRVRLQNESGIRLQQAANFVLRHTCRPHLEEV